MLVFRRSFEFLLEGEEEEEEEEEKEDKLFCFFEAASGSSQVIRNLLPRKKIMNAGSTVAASLLRLACDRLQATSLRCRA